jgi:ferredoxin-NADP reductase
VRSYSLSSAPGASAYRITVKHEPHGIVSGYLTGSIRAGALVDVAAPRGEFVLGPDTDTGAVLLISAGIGLTPVLAMLHQLAMRQSTRPVWWIHTARGPNEHPLAAEAHELLASLPNAREFLFYTAATDEERRIANAMAGRLTENVLAQIGFPTTADAYVCGPSAFMAAVSDALTAIGVDAARIHTELFGATAAINPGVVSTSHREPHLPEGPPGTGPLVTFARSGLTIPFDAKYPSVLDLADACEVNTRWSCRTGVCHTCVTPLLSGDVAYRPEPLEFPAAGEVLICCSRPSSDLVLDM